MGRKGIGRHHKAGSRDSATGLSRRQVLPPDEGRAGHYQFGAAHKRTDTTKTKKRIGRSSNSSNSDDDEEDAGTESVLPVRVLKLASVTVGKERYLFGKGSMASTEVVHGKELDFGGVNSILTAVHNSGKSLHEKVAALIIAINDPSVQVLFKAAGISTMTTLPRQEELATSEVDSPIPPQVLLQAPTSGGNRQQIHSDRQKKQNLWSLTTQPVEEDAFEFTRTGEPRKNNSGKAAQMAKSRQVTKIRNSILNSGLSHAQQIVALRDAANHPQLRSIVKSAGQIVPDESQVALFHESQRKRLFETAFSTEKKQGRSTDDKRSFLEANLVACANSPDAEDKPVPKKIARIESLGLSRSTGYRLLKKADAKRKHIRQSVINISWSNVRKRKGYTKVDANRRQKLNEWVLNHHMLVPSPNSSDTLLIRDPEDRSIKTRTSKLYLQISMRELHNDLLSDPPLGLPEALDANGEPLISDTALRALLPPQVRSMTKKHKQMCGCEVCVIIRQQQMLLNASFIQN